MGAPEAERGGAEFYYTAFGVALQSAVKIPGFLEANEPSETPYRIRFEPVTRRIGEAVSADTVLVVRHESAICTINFADGTAAEIDTKNRLISVESIEDASLEDTASYLTGPVVAMLARLEGRACFHAAVVVIDGEAHILCGPSESGKSTTAAAFAHDGFSVMSDDVCAIDAEGDSLRALSGNPRIQLWEDAARMVFGSDHGLPQISPPWEKLYLTLLDPPRFESEPRRIVGVWIFTWGIGSVQSIYGSKCLTSIVSNAYLPQYATSEIRRREFEVATEICRSVPVRLLPGDLNPAERVRTIVREHNAAKARKC